MPIKCVAKMLTSSAAFSTGSACCDHMSSREQESDTIRLRKTLYAHQPCCCPALGVDIYHLHFVLSPIPPSACWQRIEKFRLLVQVDPTPQHTGWLVSSVIPDLEDLHHWCCQLYQVLVCNFIAIEVHACNDKKKKKDFKSFWQPTQPIACANHGNHVQITIKSRQSTT